jgi:hypothetical protein
MAYLDDAVLKVLLTILPSFHNSNSIICGLLGSVSGRRKDGTEQGQGSLVSNYLCMFVWLYELPA